MPSNIVARNESVWEWWPGRARWTPERPRGRLHPVTLWGGLAVILIHPVRMLVAGTDSWLSFAGWAIHLLDR